MVSSGGGKCSNHGRRRITFAALLIAGILVVALLGFPTGLDERIKSTTVGILGDELKNDIVALYSGLFARRIETEDMVPMRNTGVNPFGINVFLEQEVDEDKIRRSLQMIKDAGFGWIKQQVLWSEIEIPEKGQHYDEKNGVANTWDKWDRIVDLAREYSLGVIMRLDTSPQWARPDNLKIETPPDHYDDYGDFVYSVASRYRGKVQHFIIWNEPNTTFEWGNRPVNAAEYVRLLQVAYKRAKEANPDAVVISAPLAPTIEESERAMNDVVFLQQMYDAGAKGWFDVVGANPYGLRSGPFDRRLEWDDVNFSRPMLIREVMVRNGDSDKPVWGSEMGWNALPPDFPEEPIFGRVTRQQQAEYTVKGYERILEEWPWMGMANIWHFRRVHQVNQNEQMYYFGVVENDFSPNPVYYAIKEMAGDSRHAYRGYHQETHWALSFDGGWLRQKDERASLGAYMITETSGSAIEFTFKGTELSLVLSKGPEMGRLRVEIDGTPARANRLPRDENGNAYISERVDADLWQELVPVASGLDYGVHLVRIVTEPDGDDLEQRWAFDGFVVDSRRLDWARASLGTTITLLGIVIGFAGARFAVRST